MVYIPLDGGWLCGSPDENLNNFVRMATVQFITGDRHRESGWDQYLVNLIRIELIILKYKAATGDKDRTVRLGYQRGAWLFLRNEALFLCNGKGRAVLWLWYKPASGKRRFRWGTEGRQWYGRGSTRKISLTKFPVVWLSQTMAQNSGILF